MPPAAAFCWKCGNECEAAAPPGTTAEGLAETLERFEKKVLAHSELLAELKAMLLKKKKPADDGPFD